MRTRDVKKWVRSRYPTAVCESNGDVEEINVLLPYGRSERLAYGFDERQAWLNAWRVARAMRPLDKEKR